jgi:hypothetical protein
MVLAIGLWDFPNPIGKTLRAFRGTKLGI